MFVCLFVCWCFFFPIKSQKKKKNNENNQNNENNLQKYNKLENFALILQ